MPGKNYSRNNTGKRRAADFYETPYSVTRQFLNHFNIPRDLHILEPAAGHGAITRVLEDEGFQHITSYDFNFPWSPNMDFLKEKRRFDFILTNPPYSKALDFILKCKEVATRGFALLLPLNYLHGQERWEKVYSQTLYPLTNVYVFTRYVMMGEPLREDGRFNTGMQAYAWFVWENRGDGKWHYEYESTPQIRWINNTAFVLKKEKNGKEESN